MFDAKSSSKSSTLCSQPPSKPAVSVTANSAMDYSIPTAITTSQIDHDLFRPIRVAIVNRITDDSNLSEEENMELNRLHDILSGSEDVASRTIITMAYDLIASGEDNRWSEEVKLMAIITKMLKMMKLFRGKQ